MPVPGENLTAGMREDCQNSNGRKKKQDRTGDGGPKNESIPVTSRDVVFGHVPLGNKNESTEYA